MSCVLTPDSYNIPITVVTDACFVSLFLGDNDIDKLSSLVMETLSLSYFSLLRAQTNYISFSTNCQTCSELGFELILLSCFLCRSQEKPLAVFY